MEEGFRSLVRSLRAFLGFWLAFLCAALCNTLIPIDTLRETFPLRHIITDAMVELRLRFLDAALKDGQWNVLHAVWTLLASASANFVGCFKEIFVIVTLFHFTPLLQGVKFYFTIPRWFRRSLSWLGIVSRDSATAGETADFDDSADEDASEPPELEDCSQLLFSNGSERAGGVPEVKSDARGNGSYDERVASPNGQIGGESHGLNAAGLHIQNANHSRPQLNTQTPLSPGRKGRDGRDWYVYDPVFGVIPQETRDLWQARESDSLQRREALLEAHASHKRQVPPVRFSQKLHTQS